MEGLERNNVKIGYFTAIKYIEKFISGYQHISGEPVNQIITDLLQLQEQLLDKGGNWVYKEANTIFLIFLTMN